MFVSIYLLTMLSVDRYISIVRVSFQIQAISGLLPVYFRSATDPFPVHDLQREKHNLSKINENVTKSKAGFRK